MAGIDVSKTNNGFRINKNKGKYPTVEMTSRGEEFFELLLTDSNDFTNAKSEKTCTGIFLPKGCDDMGMAEDERKKDEKIEGIIYDMSPSPGYKHCIINGNIHRIIGNGLKHSVCFASMENLDFQYHSDINDDYVCPDIMIVCERNHLKGGSYSGTPKFIAETLSPSTAKRDRAEKKDIYENAGVEEYWIVAPQGKSVEIYYLKNGKYDLEQSYILQDDKEEEYYNAETEICLKAFPHIKMTLKEIFDGID